MPLYYRRLTDRGYVNEEVQERPAEPVPISFGLDTTLEGAPTVTCLECGRPFRTQKAVSKHIAKAHPTLRPDVTGEADGTDGQQPD